MWWSFVEAIVHLIIPLDGTRRREIISIWRRRLNFTEDQVQIINPYLVRLLSEESATSDTDAESPEKRIRKRKSRRDVLFKNPRIYRSKKTLVLDLDETLVHATSNATRKHDFTVEVMVDKYVCLYYVYKRPYCDLFLEKV